MTTQDRFLRPFLGWRIALLRRRGLIPNNPPELRDGLPLTPKVETYYGFASDPYAWHSAAELIGR